MSSIVRNKAANDHQKNDGTESDCHFQADFNVFTTFESCSCADVFFSGGLLAVSY
nr:hypothetical protein [uncultured Desulfobacter sp.]